MKEKRNETDFVGYLPQLAGLSAQRVPVFLGSLTGKTGRCPLIAASLLFDLMIFLEKIREKIPVAP
jgi:hypothetical protein